MKRIYVMTCLALLLTLSFSSAALASSKKDIVDTAVAAGDFKTLAAALQALAWWTRSREPVRSPSSRLPTKPFAKLPAGTVEDCSSPRTKRS